MYWSDNDKARLIEKALASPISGVVSAFRFSGLRGKPPPAPQSRVTHSLFIQGKRKLPTQNQHLPQ